MYFPIKQKRRCNSPFLVFHPSALSAVEIPSPHSSEWRTFIDLKSKLFKTVESTSIFDSFEHRPFRLISLPPSPRHVFEEKKIKEKKSKRNKSGVTAISFAPLPRNIIKTWWFSLTTLMLVLKYQGGCWFEVGNLSYLYEIIYLFYTNDAALFLFSF